MSLLKEVANDNKLLAEKYYNISKKNIQNEINTDIIDSGKIVFGEGTSFLAVYQFKNEELANRCINDVKNNLEKFGF